MQVYELLVIKGLHVPNTTHTPIDADLKSHIILLAHGSSDSDWSATFEKMAEPTCASLSNVSVAYMELSQPSMEDVIRSAATKGCTHIIVVPLFLAAGKHLKVDIPRKLEKLKEETGISYKLLPAIGEHPLLSLAIKEIVTETLNGH